MFGVSLTGGVSFNGAGLRLGLIVFWGTGLEDNRFGRPKVFCMLNAGFSLVTGELKSSV